MEDLVAPGERAEIVAALLGGAQEADRRLVDGERVGRQGAGGELGGERRIALQNRPPRASAARRARSRTTGAAARAPIGRSRRALPPAAARGASAPSAARLRPSGSRGPGASRAHGELRARRGSRPPSRAGAGRPATQPLRPPPSCGARAVGFGPPAGCVLAPSSPRRLSQRLQDAVVETVEVRGHLIRGSSRLGGAAASPRGRDFRRPAPP